MLKCILELPHYNKDKVIAKCLFLQTLQATRKLNPSQLISMNFFFKPLKPLNTRKVEKSYVIS